MRTRSGAAYSIVFTSRSRPSVTVKRIWKLSAASVRSTAVANAASGAWIVLVKATVYDVAFRALKAAGLPVVDERIPFPGSGQQRRFVDAFTRALAA